jgi:large subunit ribosomal protein L10
LTRSQKAELIDYLTSEFKASEAIAVCDYKGLGVSELESLRDKAKESELKVRVVKNTLASIALKSVGFNDAELKDTNLLVWGADQISVAKTVFDYAKTNKDKFVIKSGFVEGEACDINKLEALSKLPSRDELIGMLLSVWTAPARNFVTGLDNLRAKKEEENS